MNRVRETLKAEPNHRLRTFFFLGCDGYHFSNSYLSFIQGNISRNKAGNK